MDIVIEYYRNNLYILIKQYPPSQEVRADLNNKSNGDRKPGRGRRCRNEGGRVASEQVQKQTVKFLIQLRELFEICLEYQKEVIKKKDR
jgi:hypothetical protein